MKPVVLTLFSAKTTALGFQSAYDSLPELLFFYTGAFETAIARTRAVFGRDAVPDGSVFRGGVAEFGYF